MVALISILGLSWLGSSFFEGSTLVGGIPSGVQSHPWVFALGMFALSVLLFSRAAAVVTLVPVGLALVCPHLSWSAPTPRPTGLSSFPPTVLVAVSFDQTGTRFGRYLLDHSFMRPGRVAG